MFFFGWGIEMKSYTPQKTNMEPEKGPFGKGTSFANYPFLGSMFVFLGCTIVQKF